MKTFWGETKTVLRHVSTRPELTVEKIERSCWSFTSRRL